MNYFQETAYSSDTSSTHNSLYSSSSLSQTTPPLTSTPTTSLITTTPINVPPLRPKKNLSSGAQEFVPTPPPNFKHNVGNDCNYTNAMNRRRGGYICASNGGSSVPLNMPTHCSLLNSTTHNQLILRQQQILHEKQQLLQRQQQEYAAATIAKQQLVLSAAAVANHPQDEIANSLKMFAVLSACKGNETPPSPDEVMQDFATNGYTTDELNRYQQYQAVASNMQTFANSNVFPNTPNVNQCDYNMNSTNGYINWLYNQQILQENAYNDLLRQNFLNLLPQQIRCQAETAYAAAAAINMDYNSQNMRQKRTHFKKEGQMAVRRCVFCENNNEPDAVVKSHAVRDAQGRVLCPKLRIYVCPICGVSGDDAHTVKYCPQKPIVTMDDAIKAESNRVAKANFIQKPQQIHINKL